MEPFKKKSPRDSSLVQAAMLLAGRQVEQVVTRVCVWVRLQEARSALALIDEAVGFLRPWILDVGVVTVIHVAQHLFTRAGFCLSGAFPLIVANGLIRVVVIAVVLADANDSNF